MNNNLPPGVSVNDIPGNRPEDFEYELFHTTVEKMLATVAGKERVRRFFEYIDQGDYEEVLREYVDIAAGLAAARAVIETKLSEEMAKMWEEEE